jgi:hypothetical protein
LARAAPDRPFADAARARTGIAIWGSTAGGVTSSADAFGGALVHAGV